MVYQCQIVQIVCFPKYCLHQSFDEDNILESKLSVLSDIDKPSSPAGEAFKDYRLNSEDKTQKARQEYRKNIMEVTKEDIVEAAASTISSFVTSIIFFLYS